jgi:hypothetical protein
VASTNTASRSGQFGALATVALWCASFALIKHLVDAGLAAPDVALGRFLVAASGFALAVAIGARALGEPVTAWLLLGGALVIGGVALAQRQPARARAVSPQPCAEAAETRP